VSGDPKSATALIAKEVAEAVPKHDKLAAGQAIGAAFVNAGEALRDLTALVANVVALPRVAAGFALRMIHKWRQVPHDRRNPIPPQLLLEAWAGYAAATDDELRNAFERLVTASMDRETAFRVHPSFASSLSQMTPLDARLMRLINEQPRVFDSFDEQQESLGMSIDFRHVAISASNLKRLGSWTSARLIRWSRRRSSSTIETISRYDLKRFGSIRFSLRVGRSDIRTA
jgi:hypothetical protein